MPPVDTGRGRPYGVQPPERPTTAQDWPPQLLDPAMLAELPVPLQMMVATALLPYEVAMTSVKIMKNTEALLAEMVFHLNALRPAVGAVSQAYADGQFDQVFRTIDQIQHGTNAFALVWAPLTAVRDRFVPGATVTVQPQPSTPPRPPRPRQAPPLMISPVPAPAPPSTAEYLGWLGVRAWDQAASLPGAGLLRRAGRPLAGVWPAADRSEPPEGTGSGTGTAPTAVADHGFGYGEEPMAGPVHADQPRPGSGPYSLFSLAEPLVPGPVRRLFGG